MEWFHFYFYLEIFWNFDGRICGGKSAKFLLVNFILFTMRECCAYVFRDF